MSSKPLIANEVLAFINHAIDYMDEVSIVQICRSAYKEEEVCSAKLLLFQSLGQLEQMPSRRRDGGDKSLQDIISLLKRTDPDDVPEFVAKDLHKLPPVTFDHVDVTRLLKDITCLKASLEDMKSKMEASQVTISDLRGEVALLRNAVSISGSLDVLNVNTRRGAQNASVISFESANSSASPVADVADDAPRPAAAAAAVSTPAAETCVGTSTPKRAYAAVAATNKPAVTQLKRAKSKGGKQTRGTAQPQTGPKKDTCDKDGFIKVERRKKRPPCRNQCGTAQTGPNILLRPAVPTTQLYVSRLHHTTTVEQIVEYVRSKTNWTLRVAKLESRHNTNFNSFMVRVPTHHVETFLKEEFWPKGVVYRKFRGWLRDTSQRNTTPTLRVH
ncbi:hypothetical protein B5X24_HaOG213940 [Helicoverpa armigera]|uniref:Mutant cadherin n=1 Tax=Helicoverpa armigera TaxID=29058 RepID=A0A2W1B666_HELAM|nr:hypothetical protein B5X24_HaOG213940 [Helicoverpa armigera]